MISEGELFPLLPWAGQVSVGHGHGFTVFEGDFGPIAAKITVFVTWMIR